MSVLPVLEVCCDSAEAATAALHGLGCGAHNGSGRIELCSALADGGLTPSVGLQEAVVRMAAAAERPVPVTVLVRPRGGDFCYSTLEHEIMVSRDEQMKAAAIFSAAADTHPYVCSSATSMWPRIPVAPGWFLGA